MVNRVATAVISLLLVSPAGAIDVADLWEPGDPAASEVRMLVAIKNAQGDDALIIHTQIARTYMFRGDFEQAREILHGIESGVATAGSEAQARYWLELGRSYASHRHPHGSLSAEAFALARAAYQTALAITKEAGLDGLTVDVLHMFAFTETDPARQLAWTSKALDAVLASDQPAAQRWEPSIRSNLGEAYFDLEQYVQALEQFQRALSLRESHGASPSMVRDASWHVARTLRNLGQLDRALKIQRRLADEAYVANEQRFYIHDELSLLYAALQDPERARHFAEHSATLRE